MYKAYLIASNNTCVRTCPAKFYTDTANGTVNTCQPCDISCLYCTANPSPCSQCNPTYYLYNSVCGSTCPTGYFADNVTWSCLLCDQWCVNVTMDMYFADATNQQLYIDMKFS